jgi:predicted RNase H-like HicB family nuclease
MDDRAYDTGQLELPEAISQGRTLEQAKANLAEALEAALAWRVDEGEPIPPSGPGHRVADHGGGAAQRPVKRTELERWLRSHGVEPVLDRGRGGHEAWRHTETGAKSLVPRHSEVGVSVANPLLFPTSAGGHATRRFADHPWGLVRGDGYSRHEAHRRVSDASRLINASIHVRLTPVRRVISRLEIPLLRAWGSSVAIASSCSRSTARAARRRSPCSCSCALRRSRSLFTARECMELGVPARGGTVCATPAESAPGDA